MCNVESFQASPFLFSTSESFSNNGFNFDSLFILALLAPGKQNLEWLHEDCWTCDAGPWDCSPSYCPALCSVHFPQRFPPFLQPRFFVPRLLPDCVFCISFLAVDGNRDECCSNYAVGFLRSKTEPEVLLNGPLVLSGNARSHRVHALSIPAALTKNRQCAAPRRFTPFTDQLNKQPSNCTTTT